MAQPDTATDPVAAWITDTRNGTRAIKWPEDVDRLLAALEAVRALTGEWLDPEDDGIPATALIQERARVRASCAESLNRGISAALLGAAGVPVAGEVGESG